MRTVSVFAVACAVVLAVMPATADPVIPDYQFKLVDGKPAVIPGTTSRASYSTLGITNPNPEDTGEGLGHQYLVASGYTTGGSKYHQLQFYHRNDVAAYDDVSASDSLVSALNHGDHYYESTSRPPGEFVVGSVAGPGQTSKSWRITSVYGRMTHEDYWLVPTGSSDGPLREWQPRDTRSGQATYNSYLVYPEANPATTSNSNYDPTGALGVHHTTSTSQRWGTSGYNKKGGLYVETLNAGTPDERIRGISFGTYWRGGAWGFGLYEVGPWTPPADPMNELGSRTMLSSGLLMSESDVNGLVPNVDDSYKTCFHDGDYLYFGTSDGTNVYLSAVEITDWDNETWAQVDLSSGPEDYQTFTFDSGNPNSSLLTTSGLVFAPDPDNPDGDPLLYILNGKQRIFVLAPPPPPIPEPAGLSLLGLALLGLRRKRR